MTRSRKPDARSARKRARQALRDAQYPRSNRTAKQPNTDDAVQLARLLLSGIPVDQSLAYLDPAWPNLTETQRAKCQSRWLNSPLLAAEMSLLQGGDWPSLDKDVRIRLAFDKHLAELAYLLYSKSYATASGADERKLDNARTSIAKYLEVSTTDPEAPWMKALKDLYEGKVEGQSLMDASERAIQQHTKKGVEES